MINLEEYLNALYLTHIVVIGEGKHLKIRSHQDIIKPLANSGKEKRSQLRVYVRNAKQKHYVMCLPFWGTNILGNYWEKAISVEGHVMHNLIR